MQLLMIIFLILSDVNEELLGYYDRNAEYEFQQPEKLSQLNKRTVATQFSTPWQIVG